MDDTIPSVLRQLTAWLTAQLTAALATVTLAPAVQAYSSRCRVSIETASQRLLLSSSSEAMHVTQRGDQEGLAGLRARVLAGRLAQFSHHLRKRLPAVAVSEWAGTQAIS
jgi:hypothetical protein